MKYTILLLFSYSKQLIVNNKLISAVGAYMIFSVLLLFFTGIDICIPCLWTTITGHNCFGCGLTRAFMCLLVLDVIGAYNYNPLIFIVLPGVLIYFVRDFMQYKKDVRM